MNDYLTYNSFFNEILGHPQVDNTMRDMIENLIKEDIQEDGTPSSVNKNDKNDKKDDDTITLGKPNWEI